MKIRDIPEFERPRERLEMYGVESLSNEELLSILLGSGTKNASVKDLSFSVLKEFSKISDLREVTMNKLTSIRGIGKAKAFIILSSVELGKRLFSKDDFVKKPSFINSKMIYEDVRNLFNDKKQELFYCFYFDNRQHMIGKKLLFIGTVNKSIVHPREVFKYAYLYSASNIVCAHNHPSGDIKPSNDDLVLTDALVNIGKINKIPVIDHLIIGNNNYYSFKDNGQIING